MSAGHDLPSESLAPASPPAAADDPPPAGDPLSDVLQGVKLTGALFFLVDATAPWCVDVPEAAAFAEIILPRARHVISYHVAIQGQGLASVPGEPPVAFETGDVIIFPHADPYAMRSAPGVPPELDAEQTLQFFRDLAAGRLPFVIPEGGGEDPPAQFVCGFLGCDAAPFNPLLATLPRLLHVKRGAAPGRDLLDQLIDLTLAEARAPRAGGDSIRVRLSELLFVEVVRRHIAGLPESETGWLAGLRDPAVGRALALLHDDPARAWSLDDLARGAGLSRSALAERFAQLVGQPPMQYLTSWRMQRAARLLGDGDRSVAQVASAVGYASEAAFSRAFKKIAGVPPSRWRRHGGG